MLNAIDDIRRENARILVEQIGSQAAFSRKIERQPTQVNRFIGSNYTNNIGDSMARHIEKCFNLPSGWLDQDRARNSFVSESIARYANGNKVDDIFRGCPVITFEQAGLEHNDATEWMPCPVKHGKRTYILQVKGESMFSPSGSKSFKTGDYIFVDPDRMPENGSLVIAKNTVEKEATFKQLIIDGGKCYLKALNRDWPERIVQIDGSTRICGVVICKLEQY